ATQDPQAIAGMPLAYVVIPADYRTSLRTAYVSWWQIGVLTDDVVTPNFPVMTVQWKTNAWTEKVTTPLTGTVDSLVSGQFEDGVHEKWNLCPGVGLCAVTPINDGRAELDPNLRMLRVK